MDFFKTIRMRFACRAFQDKPVEEEKLIKILDAGRMAPSACNLQPWHFVVIRDSKARQKVVEAYPREWFAKAPVIIVACSDHSQSWKRFDGKDHSDIDAAIAIDHITLAAADLGLATCWVCAFDADKCSRALKLPNYIEPVAMLPLGYPADSASPDRHDTRRKSLDDIVHWETFSS